MKSGRRQFLRAGVAAALGATGLYSLGRQSSAAEPGTFEVTRTEEEWRKLLTPTQYKVLREEATERPFTSPLNNEHRKGIFRCAGCDLDLFSVRHEVRERHGLAELLAAARQRGRHDDRPELRHGPHGRALPPLRRPSWAMCSTTARSRRACATA